MSKNPFQFTSESADASENLFFPPVLQPDALIRAAIFSPTECTARCPVRCRSRIAFCNCLGSPKATTGESPVKAIPTFFADWTDVHLFFLGGSTFMINFTVPLLSLKHPPPAVPPRNLHSITAFLEQTALQSATMWDVSVLVCNWPVPFWSGYHQQSSEAQPWERSTNVSLKRYCWSTRWAPSLVRSTVFNSIYMGVITSVAYLLGVGARLKVPKVRGSYLDTSIICRYTHS